MRGDGIRDVPVVVPVTGRGLNESGSADAGAILLHDQLLNAHGTLLGPRGLMSPKGRARIAASIGRDDVWMYVDDWNVHSSYGAWEPANSF